MPRRSSGCGVSRKQWLVVCWCFIPWTMAMGEPDRNSQIKPCWLWTGTDGVVTVFAKHIPTCLSNSSPKGNKRWWGFSRRFTWHHCVCPSALRHTMCMGVFSHLKQSKFPGPVYELALCCPCLPVALVQCLCFDKVRSPLSSCSHWLFCAWRLSSSIPEGCNQGAAAGSWCHRRDNNPTLCFSKFTKA